VDDMEDEEALEAAEEFEAKYNFRYVGMTLLTSALHRSCLVTGTLRHRASSLDAVVCVCIGCCLLVHASHTTCRYEEPGSAAIVSHPREVEGTLRKKVGRTACTVQWTTTDFTVPLGWCSLGAVLLVSAESRMPIISSTPLLSCMSCCWSG
jgi:hypothetical protein